MLKTGDCPKSYLLTLYTKFQFKLLWNCIPDRLSIVLPKAVCVTVLANWNIFINILSKIVKILKKLPESETKVHSKHLWERWTTYFNKQKLKVRSRVRSSKTPNHFCWLLTLSRAVRPKSYIVIYSICKIIMIWCGKPT